MKNESTQYPLMLLAQAFTLLLLCSHERKLDLSQLPARLLEEQCPVILIDIVRCLFDGQCSDGSWASKREPTSYALLALASMRKLPWIKSIADELHCRVQRARQYLVQARDDWSRGEHVWIGKVAYSLSNLSLVYCMAAVKAADASMVDAHPESDCFGIPYEEVASGAAFLSRVPTSSRYPKWKLELLILQALQFVPRLRKSVNTLALGSVRDKTLQCIAFTWIAASDLVAAVPIDTRWQMMLIYLVSQQFDDCIELMGQKPRPVLDHAKRTVLEYFSNHSNQEKNDQDEVDSEKPAHRTIPQQGDATWAEALIIRYVEYLLQHPKVVPNAGWLRSWLHKHLQRTLLANLHHLEDSLRLARKDNCHPGSDVELSDTFFDWTRGKASYAAYIQSSFAFYLCILDMPEKSSLSYTVARYVLEDVGMHLAGRYRLLNDVGGFARDNKNSQLNSIHLVLASTKSCDPGPNRPGAIEEQAKNEILRVAEYERACTESSMSTLSLFLDARLANAIQAYIDVIEFNGQIYMTEDIGSSITIATGDAHKGGLP